MLRQLTPPRPWIKTFLACSFLALPATWLPGESPRPALSEIGPTMSAEVAAQHAAGIVTLVMQEGKVLHHGAVGYADRELQQPMATDHMFWMASMTKSLSATAIMTLVDEGKLSLDEPASTWLPELRNAKLKSGEALKREPTLRDLLSHTSGLAFPPRKPTDGAHALKSYTLELIKAPFAFQPGESYEYGFGITVAGRIAEIVSQQPFEQLMQERLFTPLGMKDTTFHPNASQRTRLAKTYKTKDDKSALVRANNSFVTWEPGEQRMPEPSGGLFSTAADMAKFYQMILDGGVAHGKRIVSTQAIEEMTRPHPASGQVHYGLGWQCSGPDRAGILGFSTRSFGHGGAFGTHGWVDPESKVVAIFLVQNVLVDGGGAARSAFHAKVTGVSPPSQPAPRRP
jgi:CubicO group peptidase (beta-lactamase class C family)